MKGGNGVRIKKTIKSSHATTFEEGLKKVYSRRVLAYFYRCQKWPLSKKNLKFN